MKIRLTKYEMRMIMTSSPQYVVDDVIRIIYKHARPFEAKFEELQKQIHTQKTMNAMKNILLDEICYKILGFHYSQRKLEDNPEGYTDEIIKRAKQITSASSTSNEGMELTLNPTPNQEDKKVSSNI